MSLEWVRHGNVVSSLLFLVPAVLAGVYGDDAIAVGCTAVLTTSLCYHSFRTVLTRWIDMATCGGCIAYFMVSRAAATWSYVGASACLGAVLVIWRVKSQRTDRPDAYVWHACVHALSSAGICLVLWQCTAPA